MQDSLLEQHSIALSERALKQPAVQLELLLWVLTLSLVNCLAPFEPLLVLLEFGGSMFLFLDLFAKHGNALH